jgi:hypothetical protein
MPITASYERVIQLVLEGNLICDNNVGIITPFFATMALKALQMFDPDFKDSTPCSVIIILQNSVY